MVLMKGFDERGFVFYTNIASQKGRELADKPKAALTFYWKSLHRQVRIRGNCRAGHGARKPTPISPRARAGADRRLGQQAVAALESRFAFEQAIARSPPNTPSARCRGRRTGPAIASCRRKSSSGTTARSACTTASNSAREHPIAPWTKTRLYPCRRTNDSANQQPAAPHAASHRSQPRHRPRHRQALFRRRLARHHLLAPPVPGKLPVGRRARRITSRSISPTATTPRGDRGDQAAAQRRTACAGQQRRDLAEGRRRRAARLDRYLARRLEPCFPGEFLCADHAGARADRRTQGRQGLGGQRHLDRRLARASVRRRGLCDLEGGAGLADARDGARFRPVGVRVNAIAPGEIDTAILSPGTEKIVEKIPLHRLGTPDEVAKIIYVLCTETSSYVNGAEIHINGGQHV